MDFYLHLDKISNNLNKLLDIHSMNILEFSRKSGISYSSLHNLINKKQNPTLETLINICKVFSINLSQLIGDLPLFQDVKSFQIKEIPVINKDDVINFARDGNDFIAIENIIISCTANITNKCFALQEEYFFSFPKNTTLFFELMTKNIEVYSNKIILISNKDNISLKKLIVDGTHVFLEAVGSNLPMRSLNNDELIAWLFQIRGDF